MKCEKCKDIGFTEEGWGLIRTLCDCDKAREVAAVEGIPWIEPEEVVDDSINRAESDNTNIGSADTGQPKQPRERKPRGKATKKTR